MNWDWLMGLAKKSPAEAGRSEAIRGDLTSLQRFGVFVADVVSTDAS